LNVIKRAKKNQYGMADFFPDRGSSNEGNSEGNKYFGHKVKD
jgi:hypothetical protein